MRRLPLLYFSRGQPGSADPDVALEFELFAARSPTISALAAKTMRDVIFINVVRGGTGTALLLIYWIGRVGGLVGADSPTENVPEDSSFGYWTLVLYNRLPPGGNMVLFGCGPGKTQFSIVNRGSLPQDPLTHEFNDHRFDQRRVHLRRRFARLVPAGLGAGASFARYFQGHGEGGCWHDRYALRSGFGFTGGLGQEFVRRDEYCDRAKRRENHPAGPGNGGLRASGPHGRDSGKAARTHAGNRRPASVTFAG